MKPSLLLILIVLTAVSTSVAQHTDTSAISVVKRDQWIHEKTQELRKFRPDTTIATVIFQNQVLEDWHKLSCRVMKSGIIRLDDGSWIYITTTSGHENKEIGDVSMAVDHKKNIYKNFGHVCGGIIHFETTQLSALKKPADFFRYFVSDTDSAAWEKVKSVRQ